MTAFDLAYRIWYDCDALQIPWECKGKGSLEMNNTTFGKQSEAYRYIVRQIENGVYAPGTLLVERRISAEIGISRTPVRAALAQLVAEDELVDAKPNCGVTVRVPVAEDIEDIYELREILEQAALVRAIKKAKSEDNVYLQHCLDEMTQALQEGRLEDFVRFDIRFHQWPFEKAGNMRLDKMMASITTHTRRLRWVVMRQESEENISLTMSWHFRILEAIQQRDAEQAVFFMKKHNRYMCQQHLARLKEKPEKQ